MRNFGQRMSWGGFTNHLPHQIDPWERLGLNQVAGISQYVSLLKLLKEPLTTNQDRTCGQM